MLRCVYTKCVYIENILSNANDTSILFLLYSYNSVLNDNLSVFFLLLVFDVVEEVLTLPVIRIMMTMLFLDDHDDGDDCIMNWMMAI